MPRQLRKLQAFPEMTRHFRNCVISAIACDTYTANFKQKVANVLIVKKTFECKKALLCTPFWLSCQVLFPSNLRTNKNSFNIGETNTHIFTIGFAIYLKYTQLQDYYIASKVQAKHFKNIK